VRRYTVTALNAELGALISGRYPAIEVEGEVAQIQVPSSGHAYLTLRDAPERYRRQTAQLACVCWADTWGRLRHRPRQGERVVCRGKLAVYEARGVYQLYITAIEPAGQGDLQKRIAQRIARLQAEGLLDPGRKRPLPAFPRYVGVATSRTGAALQDFLRVSRERFPAARILVAPCTVQGESAPPSVIRAVDLLLEDGRAEVIVVTRGGGSKEDLLPFQDEQLARFLAASPVPVLSAVGHEIDTTIADLVADAVASTPSAAAVRALPDGQALRQRVDEAQMALVRTARRGVRRREERVAALERRLRHPRDRLREMDRRATALAERLHAAMARHLRLARAELERSQARLPAATRGGLAARVAHLAGLEGRLSALSPLAVLGRGYAIVRGPGGVVTDPAQVQPGDPLSVRVAGGGFEAEVRPPPTSEPPR